MIRNHFIICFLSGITSLMTAESIAQNWFTNSSGPGDIWLTELAVDANDNIYTSGYFSGLEVIEGIDVTNFLPAQDLYDGLLIKHDPAGEFEWAITLNGSGDQRIHDIAINSSDEVIICGPMQNTVDFQPELGIVSIEATQATSFIATYSAERELIWVLDINSTGLSCRANSVITDSQDNIIITGSFSGTMDADPTEGIFELQSFGLTDTFIIKLDRDGQFIWAKQNGGLQSDESFSIAVDSEDNIALTGFYSLTCDFDTGEGLELLTSEGSQDAFVCKLDAEGNTLWARSMGGVSQEKGYDLQIDSEDNIYSTGSFMATADFDTMQDSFEITSNGNSDAYICKMDRNGQFSWVRALGGELNDLGHSLAIDENNKVLWTGQFWGAVDLDTEASELILNSVDVMDFYLIEFDEEGNQQDLKHFGGAATEYYPQVALNSESRALFTGVFTDQCDTDPSNETNWISASGYDYLLLEFDRQGATSLSEVERNVLDIRVWPNPSEGLINFSAYQGLEDVRISIEDAMGRTVSTENVSYLLDHSLSIDGPSGIYLLNLSQNDRILKSVRLVKQ